MKSQLEICGVDYFDFYLMHSQNARTIFTYFKERRAYETVLELKDEGKIRHFGISFHDRAEVLEQILTEYPQIEVVQIQLNYADFDDPAVQSRKCYEVCREARQARHRHGACQGRKPCQSPGGGKEGARRPPRRQRCKLRASGLRPGLPGILMVLSGMSTLEQMQDNISYMQDFKPLNDTELTAIAKVQEIFHSMHLIPCTACRYCTDGCPQHIADSRTCFATLNARQLYPGLERRVTTTMSTRIHGAQGLRLRQVRRVRRGLSPASSHSRASRAGRGRI